MLPVPPRVLILGLILFLTGTALLLLTLEGGHGWAVIAGVTLLFASAGSLSLGIWLSRRKVDPLDQRRERRLWKSGPLGRKWLEDRRKLP